MSPLLHAGFDHTYAVVNSLKGFEDLGRRGFSLAPRAVEHPGGVHCRFIYFPSTFNLTLGGSRATQYLEFVSIPAMSDYMKLEAAERAKLGLSPRKPDEITRPGLSLAATGLEARLPEISAKLGPFKPNFEHRNYAWKTVKERGPGWNYLKFGAPLLPFVETWVTEYEADPSREEYKNEPHSNTCSRILGCVWDTPAESLKTLETLGGATCGQGSLAFADGFTVWNGGPALNDLAQLKLCSGFKAMVLGCDSLAQFKSIAKPEIEVKWNGFEAAILQPSTEGWALVVIQNINGNPA